MDVIRMRCRECGHGQIGLGEIFFVLALFTIKWWWPLIVGIIGEIVWIWWLRR